MSFSELFSYIIGGTTLIGLGMTLRQVYGIYSLHFICLAFCQVLTY